jgi:hypothetical protein
MRMAERLRATFASLTPVRVITGVAVFAFGAPAGAGFCGVAPATFVNFARRGGCWLMGRAKYGCQCRSGMMSREEVVPQLAANMNAAFKKVWKIIGATNPGAVDLIVTRIAELAKDGVYDTEELSRRTLSSLNSAEQNSLV